MRPKIDDCWFGSITVEGKRFEHDIIIHLSGKVRKRDKNLSKAVYGTSHTLSLAEIKDLIGMYASTEDETPQLLECLRVMSKRREALEQQREDIEAMLAEISLFERQCHEELARRDNP